MKCLVDRVGSFILVLLILGVFAGCREKNNREAGTIQMKLILKSTENEQQIRIEELKIAKTNVIDSLQLKGTTGKTLKLKAAEAGFYMIRNKLGQTITLQLDPGEDIVIRANAEALNFGYSVTGSAGSAILKDYADETNRNMKRYDSLKGIFKEVSAKGDFPALRAKLDSAYFKLVLNQRTFVEKLINANPSSLCTVFLLNQSFGPQYLFDEKKDLELYARVDSAVLKKYPGNEHAKAHHLRVTRLLNEQTLDKTAEAALAVGETAPAIELPELDGKPGSLKHYSGKAVLVYFWQSVYAPCRKENLELMRFYAANKKRIPPLLGVSFDPDPEMTSAAVKIDAMSGQFLNDVSGPEGRVGSSYNVKNKLPRYFLINADGKIAGKFRVLSELKAYVERTKN